MSDALIATDPRHQHMGSVAWTLPEHLRNELVTYASDAHVGEQYVRDRDVNFIYEILHKEGWEDKVRPLAELWVKNEDNVQRAARQVRRQPRVEGADLINGFCIFRLKTPSTKEWIQADGLGLDNKPQTVVFVALETLSPENGFFMSLQAGQDVCLDSKASVKFPPTGGGLGVFLSIKI